MPDDAGRYGGLRVGARSLLLSVNFVFLILFHRMHPMVHYPSSSFKGQNLFHLVELLSGVTTVSGNAMALIGAER